MTRCTFGFHEWGAPVTMWRAVHTLSGCLYKGNDPDEHYNQLVEFRRCMRCDKTKETPL